MGMKLQWTAARIRITGALCAGRIPEEEIRGFFHSLLRLKRDVLRHCRLTAVELTDALYLHFDGPGYGILAVVTERGQAVTPQSDASDSLLLEAPGRARGGGNGAGLCRVPAGGNA